MKKLFAFLLGAVLTTFVSAQTKNDPGITALEPEFRKILSDWQAVGFAVAVVHKDKVIYSNGFGYRDLEKKLPVTPNTLFAIGSCTKAFTASLIGMLDRDKKVDIDKPAYNYLPSLSFYKTEMTNAITLRDMMSHRTGLPRHDISWYLFPSSTRDSLLSRIPYLEPSAGVKERYQYNNFMFLLQGMVVEKATNKTWEQNVKEKIFDRLQMNRSGFFTSDMKKDPDHALGYAVRNNAVKKLNFYEIATMGPAGSINSSVTEMSRWLITWINGGKYKQKEIVPASFASQAISSQTIIRAGLPTKEVPDVHFSNYGFGWSLASYRGHYRVEHGGNIDGFSANAVFFPSDSIGIVILTNQDGSSVPAVVRNMIADKLLALDYYDWQGTTMKAVAKTRADQATAGLTRRADRKMNTRPSHPLNDYTGNYSHPGYGNFDVWKKGDSLFATTVHGSFWLRHYHYDVFEPLNIDPVDGVDTTAGNLRFQFNMAPNGDIASLSSTLEGTLKPIEFARKPKEISVRAGKLKMYEGEYEMSGIITKVYTKDNLLHLFVPGQPEYELAGTAEHKFAFKTVPGYSVEFLLDDSKKVTAMNIIQPNGTFRATKK